MSDPVLIQFRRDSTSEWVIRNPVLDIGEMGMDLARKTFKVGDGYSNWLDLDQFDAFYTFTDLFLL